MVEFLANSYVHKRENQYMYIVYTQVNSMKENHSILIFVVRKIAAIAVSKDGK